MNYRQIYAIEQKNKERILKVCPNLNENSGVYFLTRYENGFKYAYIGQAKHLLSRLAQHLSGYQHIDLSIKKHNFYTETNLNGWHINFIECENLDEMEQKLIKEYANAGYQLRNKTAGGQGKGKADIVDKVAKGYQSGLQNGYNKARRDIAKLFEKNLKAIINGDANKLKERALEKFKEFINIGD